MYLLETLTADPRDEFAELRSLFDAASVNERTPSSRLPAQGASALDTTTLVANPDEDVIIEKDEEKTSEKGVDLAEKDDTSLWRLAILGITICWATNFATLKFAVDAMPHAGAGPLFVASRFLLASLAVAPWLFVAKDAQVLIKGARVGLWCAFGYVAQSLALDTFHASASTAAFECSLQTIVVAGVAAVASKAAKVPTRTALAIGLAVAGVAILCSSSGSGADTTTSSTLLMGNVIALGQAVGFGMSYVELEEASAKWPDQSKPLAAIQCLVVALAAVIVAVVSSSEDTGLHTTSLISVDDITAFAQDLAQTPAAIFSLVWMALISTALTIWLQTIAFAKVPATDASIILVTEPLWAAVCARVLLAETFGPVQMLGGAFVLAAVAVNDGLIDLGGNDDDVKL